MINQQLCCNLQPEDQLSPLQLIIDVINIKDNIELGNYIRFLL